MPVIRKTAHDLKDVAAVAQCLDNQWLPRELAAAASISFDDGFISRRNEFVKRELMAALLTSEQLVLNRAFALNNDVFARLYMDPSNANEFSRALQAEVISFCFLRESSFLDALPFHTHEARANRLAEIAAQVDTTCVRLSWNDEENTRLVEQDLARPFHDYVASLHNSNKPQLARDFGIDASAEREFFQRIDDLAAFASSTNGFLSREQVYRKYVSETDNPLVGLIDGKKPFAREVKSIIDLKYNLNLSDALDRYGITSQGDCDRSVLQEVESGAIWRSSPEEATELLATLLSSAGFSRLNTFGTLDFLQHLELADVLAIRDSDEWRSYTAAVKQGLPQHGASFFDHPLLTDTYKRTLVNCHVDLLAKAHSFVDLRARAEHASTWCELTVSFIGTAAKVVAKFMGDEYFVLLPPDIVLDGGVGRAMAPILVEFAVGGTGGPDERRTKYLRKYPAFNARVDDPLGFFRRLTERMRAIAQSSRAVKVGTLSIEQFRQNDRRGTLNPTS